MQPMHTGLKICNEINDVVYQTITFSQSDAVGVSWLIISTRYFLQKCLEKSIKTVNSSSRPNTIKKESTHFAASGRNA